MEAGMFAVREERFSVGMDDFQKAIRKLLLLLPSSIFIPKACLPELFRLHFSHEHNNNLYDHYKNKTKVFYTKYNY